MVVYALAGAGAGIDSLRDPTGRSAGAWSSVARVRDASHVARGRCRPASIACDQNPGGAFAGVGGCWVDGSHLLMGIGCETLPNSHRSGGRHEQYILNLGVICEPRKRALVHKSGGVRGFPFLAG